MISKVAFRLAGEENEERSPLIMALFHELHFETRLLFKKFVVENCFFARFFNKTCKGSEWTTDVMNLRYFRSANRLIRGELQTFQPQKNLTEKRENRLFEKLIKVEAIVYFLC